MNIYKRQSNFVKPEQLDFPILLIGAGGTGSWAGLSLAKMGALDVSIVDPDHIEAHNVASQVYFPGEIGELKSFELKKWLPETNPESLVRFYPMTFEKFFPAYPKKKFPTSSSILKIKLQRFNRHSIKPKVGKGISEELSEKPKNKQKI